MTIRIEIRGADELVRRLTPAARLDILEQPIARQLIRIEAAMKEYPPPPPTSSYRRTGTLGRRWTHAITRTIDAVTGKVGNNTSYGPWVQSKRFQANVHKGRWQTDEAVLEAQRQHIIDDIEASVRDVLSA